MALLENITYSPGEPMTDFYDKLNAAIDAINAVAAGGTADQIASKINSTDFNTQFVNSFLPLTGTANHKVKSIAIGDWNMDSTSSINVAHGLSATDYKKIKTISVMVRDDADSEYYRLDSINASTGAYRGGVDRVNSTNIVLIRTDSIGFDSTSFDSTSYNRGYILVTYEG